MGEGEEKKKIDPKSPAGLAWKRVVLSLGKAYFKKDPAKLLENDDIRKPLEEFATAEGTANLFAFFAKGNVFTLAPSVGGVETVAKRKGLAFFKLKPGALDAKNFDKQVYCVEYAAGALEGLASLTQRVFQPLLKNKANQAAWSGPASVEILQKFNAFLSDLYVVLGQSEGRTNLPLPPAEIYADEVEESQRNTLLETYVVGWSRQIHDSLEKDPGACPEPLDEVKFWARLSEDLASIKSQMEKPELQQAVATLKGAGSVVVAEFAKLDGKVAEKSFEADSNLCYLKTLEQFFLTIRDALELPSILPHFQPLMHTILLVWQHSDTYNTSERLTNLMKALCNSLVMQASKFVSGEEIFRFIDEDNVDEALERIQLTTEVLKKFKETFMVYREKADKVIFDEDKKWSSSPVDAMFARFNEFQDRCRDVTEFTLLVSQFDKLEKIFIGGTKGRQLTQQIRQIGTAFNNYKMAFKAVKYDIMDLTARGFDDDFYTFRHNVKELERRLAMILSTSFDDLPTLEAQFKLLEGFEDLLQRPIIADEFAKKLNSLLWIFLSNLRNIHEQFNSQVKNPDIKRNLPPCAGALMWCRCFRRRMDPLMNQLRHIIKITESRGSSSEELTVTSPADKLKEIETNWEAITGKMTKFEQEHILKWKDSIENTSTENLKKTVLLRDPETETITVNFDKAMVCLLRECKYLLEFGVPIPDNAQALFSKAQIYQKQICQLQLVCSMYNSIKTSLHPEELPLLSRKIEEIDEMLATGINEVCWKRTPEVDRFTGDVLPVVQACFKIFTVLKQNLEQSKTLLDEFGQTPLAERKSKALLADEFKDNFDKYFKTRLVALTDVNGKIHELIAKVQEALEIASGDPKWKAYVVYAQSHIERKLATILQNALKWFIGVIDPKTSEENNPLIEIQLALMSQRGGGLEFTTSGDATRSKKNDEESTGSTGVRLNVWDELEALGAEAFFQVGETVKKIDSEDDYQDELRAHEDTQALIGQFKQMIAKNKEFAEEHKKLYEKFQDLYAKDRAKEFKAFLKADGINRSDKGDQEDHQVDDFGELPNLEAFAKKIGHFKEVNNQIDNTKTPCQVGWLRIDASPLKQALTTWCSKWSHTFTSYLDNQIVAKVENLANFMEGVDVELADFPKKGDLDHLKRMLGVIHLVRSRQESTLEMFKPLNEIIKFLQVRDVEVSEKHIKMLEVMPQKWESLVDKVFRTKEQVNPLQDEQVDSIKRKVWDFAEEMMNFRNEFREKAPFQWTTDTRDCYARIMEWYKKTDEQAGRANRLNQLESLFELSHSRYRQIKDCRHEIRLLKQLWDMIDLSLNTFNSWRKELWDKIDTEAVLAKVNRLSKQINAMDKEIRGWKAFQGLQDEVKNYQIVLPLVSLLHSETMKDRHWKMLMDVTKTTFTMGPDFCLGDMLDLGLHQSVEEVEEVVEISDKEAKIEAQLLKLEGLWKGDNAQCLEYGVHDETGVGTLRVPEELMVNLEESMALLQGMKGQGKYVEYFLKDVNQWEQNMGTTETVINDWLIVGSKWSSLQSIFIGSEDIREQLPEDSKRFDGIDEKWRALMKAAVDTNEAIDACCAEGRSALLEGLKGHLELCEKSLNQYLETKKMAFPRFYFLSNVALLDLLSNGNNPQAVMRHIPSCFNNVQKFEFEKDPLGNPTKNAIGMYSQAGGEYVPWSKPFKCEGAVEDWLNGSVEMMRECLQEIVVKARTTADNWDIEKPREEWLYDYCAQCALTACQLVWTEEVELQFEALSDGNETALKDYLKVCGTRLQNQIQLVMGKLNRRDRTKVMTIITVDVHNRDVVQMLIDNKISDPSEFSWQSQMRYRMTDENRVQVLVADWVFNYAYEYIGNTGRLVITPLTDRCYITLTQAMNLIMGGAPAGPAGTGKTETVKDLGRACAVPVYVFNCSEQMNVVSLGNIFKGLCQTGGWGCFDEFNRIPIEVLSVVATQVDSFLTALRANKNEFDLLGVRIRLVPTVGVFITMNPGYAGRTELPENLKALFRSCAMVVPDMELICENMLMSEGFLTARPLAHKFITLYSLSKELLSQQRHYDWGLRAVKAVLRVAGGLKRAEPDISETLILMRALRDFNIPKIISPDQPIFLRLIDDLFPGMKIDRKIDPKLQSAIEKVTIDLGRQPEAQFCRKVTELHELLEVRHSVFILGQDGVGKSSVWKSLAAAYNELGQKCVSETMNPKAVRNDELYGWLSATTGDWYDGILSTLMRNMSQCEGGYTAAHIWKWIVMDTDIDPEWIESLNTVMDDNKVLTLVSNERIPLSDSMRLIFEVAHLDNATPATVSRAGILCINLSDVGVQPFLHSWIESRPDEKERSILEALFHKLITPEIVLFLRRKFQSVVPQSDLCKLQALCYVLEGTLGEVDKAVQKLDAETTKLVYERAFVFAMIWAFGGCMLNDVTRNCQKEFSDWAKKQFQNVMTLPFDQDVEGSNLVFDYFFDIPTNTIKRWETKVEKYNAPILQQGQTLLVNSLLVETVDTTRLTWHAKQLIKNQNPIMFVGTSGTGKTSICRNFLGKLPKEKYTSAVVNLNSFTDATALRKILQQYVEKRSGRTFGPPTGKKLVYYVDDLNMPYVDTYGTQSPIALIRQHMDTTIWYDTLESDPNRKKKIIRDCQYMASMNNKAGSFIVNPRLMSHFMILVCNTPTRSDMQTIFKSILGAHLELFDPSISEMCDSSVNATIDLLADIQKSPKFRPTTIKFHYQFTIRDMANVLQGLVLSRPGTLKSIDFARLWLHECNRVFGDRMINQQDLDALQTKMVEYGKKNLEVDSEALQATPLLFTSFVADSKNENKNVYTPVETYDLLNAELEEQLAEYNENNAVMPLVLFEMAMDHVVRIARIIKNPQGSALLVGVGGSGKQSLSRLASWLCGYEVFQLEITRSYGEEELREDIQKLYMKAGIKGKGITFLLTDANIKEEEWLVHINDILSSGEIPKLFDDEQKDSIFSSLRNVAKKLGLPPDDRKAMYKLFIDRVRTNLHVVLCFSPVGETFRIRARKFPALVNCTSLDWFFPWPRQALCSVAERFLDVEDLELGSPEVRTNVAHHMAEVHLSVQTASKKYLERNKRYNYTTPKSFLELIAFYKKCFKDKSDTLYKKSQRLEKGIATLQKTAKDVEALKEDLTRKLEIVEEKKVAADELIAKCGKERMKVDEQKGEAEKEAGLANEEKAKADAIKADCQIVLDKAMPALEAAKEAVSCLSKASLTELKNLAKPDKRIVDVTKAVLILKEGEYKDHSWKRAKLMMKDIGAFLRGLEEYKGEDIEPKRLTLAKPLLALEHFKPEVMTRISQAAANLCGWACAIVQYNEVYKEVAPKMASAAEADGKAKAAMARLDEVNEAVRLLEEKLKGVEESLQSAVEEKNAVEQDAQRCLDRLNLAERLVNGLSTENKRWGIGVERLAEKSRTLVGDVLLQAAFVSYIGAFNQAFRQELWTKHWVKDLVEKEIPLSDTIKNNETATKDVLSSGPEQAKWANEGLPVDNISIENASIVTLCDRWPLFIDPQLQGLKWIKSREKDLKVVTIGQGRWMSVITHAVSNGDTVLIENAPEQIDPTLNPILSRAIIKKGRSKKIKIGGEEVDYDDKFQLYIQSKMSNPHYQPEIFAQCTVINFIVTETGLEEQLLALVVNDEKPELEEQRVALMRSINEYMVSLNDLENELLFKLSNAPDDILSDISLIEGLEKTKAASTEIEQKVAQAKESEIMINKARNEYRPVAKEASWIYFLLIELNNIDHMYQYSLDAFVTFFYKAMKTAKKSDDIKVRVKFLSDMIRIVVFTWVSRGLFEKHKLIFSSQLTFKLMFKGAIEGELNADYFDVFIRGTRHYDKENPIPWLPDASWYSLCAAAELPGLEKLTKDIVASPNRFKEWYLKAQPENESLPLDWRKLDTENPFAKVLVIKCLRPDRVTVACENFVRTSLPDGRSYTELDAGMSFANILKSSLEDANNQTPIFFILSSGADPVSTVYSFAVQKGYVEAGKYHRVALGQGQDVVAMKKLAIGHKEGGWVVLENIHLMPKWCKELEKTLTEFAQEGSHEDFRVFLSAEPSNGIPIGVLESSIKLTNEPPQGLKANLKRAFASFEKDEFDFREASVKTLTFALCWFHAVIIERKKFGPQGWNADYPFNTGDLVNSGTVLCNKMEGVTKIPWNDLRYIFGQIMYGGHITDDLDRLLCMSYLRFYMRPQLFDELDLVPYVENSNTWTFPVPAAMNHEEYFKYIDDYLPQDNPIMFGLHPNTEIAVRTDQANSLCTAILSLQPKGAAAAGSGQNPTQRVAAMLEEIMEKVDDISFDIEEIMGNLQEDERGPYQYVFLQECERMDRLVTEIKRSLKELDLGLSGDLTMSERMEQLQDSLFLNQVPETWSVLAYPCLRSLGSWVTNLQMRSQQNLTWADNPTTVPMCVNVSYFFNPQSFLTAVMQITSRRNNLELDKLGIITDVTRKTFDEVDAPAREGAYICGLNLEGASWSVEKGNMDESIPRQMFCPMPVVNAKAVLQAKMETKGIYQCPVYQTQQRGPTFVFFAPLRTKEAADKWVLAGAVIIMDYVDS